MPKAPPPFGILFGLTFTGDAAFLGGVLDALVSGDTPFAFSCEAGDRVD